MNERKQQLKQAKKICKKARGKYYTGWKAAGICLLILAILLSAALVIVLPKLTGITLCEGKTVPDFPDYGIVERIGNLIGVDIWTVLAPRKSEIALYLPPATCTAWLLFLIVLIPWGIGKKEWKRSPEFLDYRTLKNISKQ